MANRIRFEERPAALGSLGLQFGPWKSDVLIRSLFFLLSTDATPAQRVPYVTAAMTGFVWAEWYPSGPFGFCAENRAVKGMAMPGAGCSTSFMYWNDTGANVNYADLHTIQIPLPYNLILPQRTTLSLTVYNAQAGDNITAARLCLEDSLDYIARPKPGAPLSSKNNP